MITAKEARKLSGEDPVTNKLEHTLNDISKYVKIAANYGKTNMTYTMPDGVLVFNLKVELKTLGYEVSGLSKEIILIKW